jgi:predicted DNA-binding protein
MDDEREDRLRRLMEATGESTKAGAIDLAIKHYLLDLENKRRVADDLETGALEELHTPYLPLERETTVGRR